MTEQQQQSPLLARLYQIEDEDTTGIYAHAKLELEQAKIKSPHSSTFDICRNESEERRKYIAEKFVQDGLQAQAMNIESWNCGETDWDYVVRVQIPKRTKAGVK